MGIIQRPPGVAERAGFRLPACKLPHAAEEAAFEEMRAQVMILLLQRDRPLGESKELSI